MSHPYSSPDPPRTLAERLTRLNDDLKGLGERLKAAIAGAVGDAVAEAVRDTLRSLLGGKDAPADHYRDPRDHAPHALYSDYTAAREDDPWGEEDRRWQDEGPAPARVNSAGSKRWRNAVGTALQAALWFLKRQPRRRPVLTTLAVTLAAGVAGLLAGPVLVAGAGVLASVAGLLLTADASRSAAELVAD